MFFEWDDNKETDNLRKHGIRFGYAALIFDNEVATRIDDRRDYGETRMISVGMVDDDCLVVVHTQRGEAIRIISAWKGGNDEKEYYRQVLSG